jgi:hypothetical protein
LVDRITREEALEMPLDRLIRRMNDPELSEVYRDKLAAVAVNFTSARLSAVAIRQRPAQMTDETIAELLGIPEQDLTRAGKLRSHFPYIAHETTDKVQ